MTLMLIKLYEEIKKIIKENYKFLLLLLITFFICTIEFPYYIEAPGGIIDIQERIEIENAYESEGTLNMAYVSEYKATLPTILISKIKKDWKLVKKEEITQNTTSEADYFRNHILLVEANQNAIKVAYQKAGLKIQESNQKVLVTYVYKGAETDIQIADEIININNEPITSKQDIQETLKNVSIKEKIDILVQHEGQQIHRTAELIELDNAYILGIVVSETSDIETTPNIEFHFQNSESGPSGGLMMSLAIYNALTKEDITHGKKIVGTGTIDKEGNVGQIDGVEYKLQAAIKEKADIFLVPGGENYIVAKQLQQKNNYPIEIVPIKTFDDALTYLKSN